MESLKGRKAILTGASGGIGVPVAEALAKAGMDLLLVAHPGAGLPEVAAGLDGYGIRSSVLVADLRDPSQYGVVVERAMAEFGRVDVLVNNAGVEFSLPYEQLTEAQIRQVIAVNLEAPMMLSRLVLPGMLARRTGHIVNLSSLAGKSGPAFQEPYAATKAGLTGFTFSLRASCRGTGVSASVVCPGFVEAGIYSRLKERSGAAAPALLAGCPPQKVARAVLRAVRNDVAEILVNRYPLRPALALATLSPAFGAWLTRWLGVNDFFRRVVEANTRSGNSE